LTNSRTQNIVLEPSSDMRGKHAVVIGGGIGGLLAARVLADFFEHVTIIERDHYPELPAPRSGTPDQQVIIHLQMKKVFSNGAVTLSRQISIISCRRPNQFRLFAASVYLLIVCVTLIRCKMCQKVLFVSEMRFVPLIQFMDKE
jgi:hypothetical protein